MLCANEYTRKCFSIIANIMIDYEKQILIIDVKSDKHCSMCQMHSHNRNRLREIYSYRSHEFTKTQLQKQANKEVENITFEVENSKEKIDMIDNDDEKTINTKHIDVNDDDYSKISDDNETNMNVHIVENFA